MNHTLDSRDSVKQLRYVIFLAATASLGGMMFGFDLGIITGAGPFLVQHFGLGDLGLGWAYSSLLFGCIVGSAVAGRLTDRYGRQRLLVVVALLFVLTSLATGLAPSFGWLITARFAGGVAVGGVSVLSPLYIAEVAPPAIRGRMGATYQLSVTAGILISYLINYWLRNAGDANWRWMFVSGALPSALFLLALLRAPETPRFLFKAGRTQEKQDLLAQLMNRQEADRETAEIKASLQPSVGSPGGYDMRRLLHPLIISFFLGMLIQISGINTIIDYAPLVFRAAGWKMDAALFSTFVIGVVNFVLTLVAFWTIDRYGRKPLYIAGSLGMALSYSRSLGCWLQAGLTEACCCCQ